MLHGQRFELGGLLVTKGFALGLGPGFATVVGLAVGLSLSLRAAGRRGGGWLASDRRCRHRRTPQKREDRRGDRRPCPEAVCGGGGSDKSQITVAHGNHTSAGRSRRIGVTSDGAENAPRLRVLYGEDSKESEPPLKRRAKTHTARTQDSSTPVPERWRSRGARIRESSRPRSASQSVQPAAVRSTAVD